MNKDGDLVLVLSGCNFLISNEVFFGIKEVFFGCFLLVEFVEFSNMVDINGTVL